MTEKIELFSEKYKTNRNILKNILPIDIPFCISIELSNICNFKCAMCPQSSEEYAKYAKPLQNMSEIHCNKILDDIIKWSKSYGKIKLIKLYSMGEPLLNEYIGVFSKAIKKADVCETVEITTNASLLTTELSRDFIEAGVDYIRASIYSVLEDKNKEITGVTISPKKIREKIRELKELRNSQGKALPFIQAKLIDTYDEHENQEFMEFYKNIADEVFIDKPVQSNNIGDVIEKLYKAKKNDVKKDIAQRYVIKEKKVCRYPFTHLTVKSSGEVVVCCADWMKNTIIGNIENNTLQEIWNSKALYDFRAMQISTKGMGNTSCRECQIPFRDCPEDYIDDFPIEKLTYTKTDMED